MKSTLTYRKWDRTPPKRRLEGSDPYLPLESAPAAVCGSCGLEYRDKRWFPAESPPDPNLPRLMCPACRRMRDHMASGEVVLEGGFLREHEGEVEALVRHEEARARVKNPLERIMDFSREGDRWVLHTTVKKLAQRIGRAVHHAFKGTLEQRMNEADTMARVHWKR